MIQRFEDLNVWQLARELVGDIYKLFEKNRDFDFKSQIQRAAVSIMNNIAEGFERGQIAKDNKQFINFLNFSYGSCGEVKSMMYIA
jgi:four helix bundle protein